MASAVVFCLLLGFHEFLYFLSDQNELFVFFYIFLPLQQLAPHQLLFRVDDLFSFRLVEVVYSDLTFFLAFLYTSMLEHFMDFF